MRTARIIRRLLAGAIVMIATFASTMAAWCYSAEAVKEAELVLELVTRQSQAGTADQTDVARAHYAVLDMKYKAKAISENEFCRSAKPLLTIAADRLRVGDEQTDAKASWVASIAAMDMDTARCRQASVAADILLFGAPRYNGSETSLKQAQFAEKLAEDRARRNLVSPIEVGRAQYELLVAEYRAGKIDHAAYCKKAVPHLRRMVATLQGQIDLGLSSLAIAFPVKRELFAAEAECGGATRA